MQTRLLDRPSQQQANKETRTKELSKQQSDMQEALLDIRAEVPLPFMDPVFEEIHGHMATLQMAWREVRPTQKSSKLKPNRSTRSPMPSIYSVSRLKKQSILLQANPCPS